MKSLAQAVLDTYNGVQQEPEIKPRKPRTPKAPQVLLTQDELKQKAYIIHRLRTGTWTVEFTKVDGTQSTMECTLDSKIMPTQESHVAEAEFKSVPKHLIRVYATDRGGWRSFLANGVKLMYRKAESL